MGTDRRNRSILRKPIPLLRCSRLPNRHFVVKYSNKILRAHPSPDEFYVFPTLMLLFSVTQRSLRNFLSYECSSNSAASIRHRRKRTRHQETSKFTRPPVEYNVVEWYVFVSPDTNSGAWTLGTRKSNLVPLTSTSLRAEGMYSDKSLRHV